jgi:hypothetical protein
VEGLADHLRGGVDRRRTSCRQPTAPVRASACRYDTRSTDPGNVRVSRAGEN